ncbi:hypothetical protein AAVH_31150, partial [Aphelenchoides avenae]
PSPTTPLEKATLELYSVRAKELADLRQELLDTNSRLLQLKASLGEAAVFSANQDIVILELQKELGQVKDQLTHFQNDDDEDRTMGGESPKDAMQDSDDEGSGDEAEPPAEDREEHSEGEGLPEEDTDDEPEYVPKKASYSRIRSMSSSSESDSDEELMEQ